MLILASLATLVQLVSAAQLPLVDLPLGKPNSHANSHVLTGKHTLHTLSTEQFTSFGHPSFPDHSVRVKQSAEFCDPTVKSYTGYIDVGSTARHIFFYFFESRGDPLADPTTLWINGGPGCSSSLGLFMELGPCSIAEPGAKGNGTKWNPHSWNSNSNLFFVDQPVGVGFSYADFGQTIETTEDAAKDIAAFMFIFQETFPDLFKGKPFHMSGESYGGRYLPLFASEIVDQNAIAIAEGRDPIQLESVLIGNGLTDVATMVPSYYDMQCTAASVPPILDIASCVAMKTALPRCEKQIKEECVDRFDAIGCSAAMSFCGEVTSDPFFGTGKNPYDISVDCEGKIEETLCYPVTKRINSYLDLPSTRKTLGVDPSIGNFTSCSETVGRNFNRRLDMLHPTYLYVAALLERGIRVLIYVGVNDWICNHVGNYRWVQALEWSGSSAFNDAPLHEWSVKVNGTASGKTQSANGLTFATIYGAGHMVPYDKPVEALTMLQRWLGGKDL